MSPHSCFIRDRKGVDRNGNDDDGAAYDSHKIKSMRKDPLPWHDASTIAKGPGSTGHTTHHGGDA